MVFAAAQLRSDIDAALARKGGARLALAPRLVCPGFETGYGVLDAVLRGGLPVAGTTEIIGARSSGRTSLAAACVAERTREGHVCAWVDVLAEMDAQACLANGAELDRLLVVRCSAETEAANPSAAGPVLHLVTPPERRERGPSHLFASHKVNPGTPSAANQGFKRERVEQVASDRQPARRGIVVLEPKPVAAAVLPGPQVPLQAAGTRVRKPWTRLEQGIRAVDLLVQAGGFGAIVFDLGSIAPQFARRIPLATWFRWRAALEKSRTSLIVLSQHGCTGSSAELVLRAEAELPSVGSVMQGVPYRLEVVRRRFAEDAMQGRRKPPAQAEASAWASRATWASA